MPFASSIPFDPTCSLGSHLHELLAEAAVPADVRICLRVSDRPLPILASRSQQIPDGCVPVHCRTCLLRTDRVSVEELPVEADGMAGSLPCEAVLATPIADRRLEGFVTRTTSAAKIDLLRLDHPLAQAAQTLARRIDLHQRARRHLGRNLWILGSDDFLTRLEQFFRRTAHVELPVLLSGEHGTGRRDAALALHLSSDRSNGSFVVLECCELRAQDALADFDRAALRAATGTLFLARVDELSPSLQIRLAERLRLLSPENRSPDRARIVASTTGPIHEALHDELAFFQWTLPPLRERVEDIEPLALYFFRSYGAAAKVLPEPLLSILLRYPWPGNIPELRQNMARLAAAFRGGPLDSERLRTYSPKLVGDAGSDAEHRPRLNPTDLLQRRDPSRGEPELQELPHPALRRALRIMLRRHPEPLSLKETAKAAHVSPSHLSHLFKLHLGASPMAFLAELRVEQAKILLTQSTELTISRIAERTGFGDLRTLERTFKKHVHISPRAFRRSKTVSGETLQCKI